MNILTITLYLYIHIAIIESQQCGKKKTKYDDNIKRCVIMNRLDLLTRYKSVLLKKYLVEFFYMIYCQNNMSLIEFF